MSRVFVLVCCAGVIVAFTSGCGGGPGTVKTVPAGGTVTFQGAPLPGASVTFVPVDGPVAMGITDVQGKFTLTTGVQEGAVLGKSKVSVRLPIKGKEDEFKGMSEAQKSMELTKRMGMNPGKMYEERDKASVIPEKYTRADSSGLEFTVLSDASKNQFKIEL